MPGEAAGQKQYPILIDGNTVLLKFRETSPEEIIVPSSKIAHRMDEVNRLSVEIVSLEEKRKAGGEIDTDRLIRLKDSHVRYWAEVLSAVKDIGSFIVDPPEIGKNFSSYLRRQELIGPLIETCTKFVEEVSFSGERGKNS